MLKVAVLGFHGALASAITGIVDIFSLAGISWNRIQHVPIQALFETKIYSHDGRKLACINGLNIETHGNFNDAFDADILIVPTIGREIQKTLQLNPTLINFLKMLDQQKKCIAANCTGNFFLAESGLLNGKIATTHWGYAAQFKQQYPLVKLNSDLLISCDEDIYCAGGGLAWFDLALHLIERFYGGDIARETAKAFVVDYRRDMQQNSYSLLKIGLSHHDELVKKVQLYFNNHFQNDIDLAHLARLFNVTERTLIRRFNQALATSPHQYLLAVRIEAARKYLEETEFSIDQILQQIGYRDASSFRRLFRRKTGLTPIEYRHRFNRRL